MLCMRTVFKYSLEFKLQCVTQEWRLAAHSHLPFTWWFASCVVFIPLISHVRVCMHIDLSDFGLQIELCTHALADQTKSIQSFGFQRDESETFKVNSNIKFNRLPISSRDFNSVLSECVLVKTLFSTCMRFILPTLCINYVGRWLLRISISIHRWIY